jgi:hypothetical protein
MAAESKPGSIGVYLGFIPLFGRIGFTVPTTAIMLLLCIYGTNVGYQFFIDTEILRWTHAFF